MPRLWGTGFFSRREVTSFRAATPWRPPVEHPLHPERLLSVQNSTNQKLQWRAAETSDLNAEKDIFTLVSRTVPTEKGNEYDDNADFNVTVAYVGHQWTLPGFEHFLDGAGAAEVDRLGLRRHGTRADESAEQRQNRGRVRFHRRQLTAGPTGDGFLCTTAPTSPIEITAYRVNDGFTIGISTIHLCALKTHSKQRRV